VPQQQNVPTSTPPTPLRPNSPKLSKKLAIITVALIGLLLAGTLLWQKMNDHIMGNRYQAVFLDNGQVYFGKLHGYYTNRPYLTDVYYFQANSQAGSTQASGGSQLLVKLGQEIHAPEGKLILNKDAILFVENLTDKGNVVEAIKNSGQSGQTAQPTGGVTR
jgi:hypothetical protein